MIKKKVISLLILFLPILVNAQGYLHADGKNIVNGAGENVILRGIGTGNWMIMEGYMMKSGDYGTQHEFRNKLIESIGVEKTDSFYNVWHRNHFTRADIDSMKAWGFNSVRPAMHYNLFTLPIEDEPVPGENTWLDKGFEMIDSLLDWCSDNEMYVILDLHGAPGGQGANAEISDYDPSKPSLWESQENKDKTVALWRKLAERYSTEPWIGGYDLINETNWTFPEGNNSQMRSLFGNITDAIREVDQNHMIIIEGNSFANDHSGLTPPWDDNFVYSGHKYWSGTGPNDMDWLIALRDAHNVPIWLGESGENGNSWFTETITLCENNNIGWSWWPVKKNDLNCVLFVDMPGSYDTLIKVWHNDINVTLTEDQMFKAVLDWAEAHKIENCEVKYDVIDAMIRQPHTNETLPYVENKLTEPIFFSDYDYGKNGFAYSDDDVGYYGGDPWTGWNNGWTLRSDGVDIEACKDATGTTNGYNVGFTNDDEWMLYSLNSDSTAAYTLEVRSASNNTSGSSFHIEVNNVVVSDVLSLPGTGGWQEWQTSTFEDIIIPAGEIKIKFYLDEGGSNLSYFNFINPKSIDAIDFTFMSAKTSMSGDSILIDLNKATTSLPADLQSSDFEILVNDIAINITGVSISEESDFVLVLTHEEDLYSDNTITVSYSGTSVKYNSQNLTGFTDMPVANEISEVYHVLPGRVQVEDFVENNGFSWENNGTTSAFANPGDYLTYRVKVTASGTYQINYKVATTKSNAKLIFQTGDGTNYTSLDTILFSSTGDWTTWETQSSGPINLEEGYSFVKLLVYSSEHNLDWFEINEASSIRNTGAFADNYILYPNPAENHTVLKVRSDDQQYRTITVYDMNGRAMSSLEGFESMFSINTSVYPKGMYFIQVQSNNEIYSEKLIIR